MAEGNLEKSLPADPPAGRAGRRGKFLGDTVYGATDGIVTTFAVVAAATGASLSPAIIIILGLANLVADGFSMGASNFLSRRSEGAFAKLEQNLVAPFQHGLATFVAFIVAGFIPLIPYLFQIEQNGSQFTGSAILAGAMFFLVGAVRARVTTEKLWLSGFEILLVGGFASAVAYGVGWLVKTMFGIVV